MVVGGLELRELTDSARAESWGQLVTVVIRWDEKAGLQTGCGSGRL